MEGNFSTKVVLQGYADFMAENDFGDARFYENLPPDDMPIIIGKFLSVHTKKDLALACSLTDNFSTRYFGSFEDKSRFASLHVKCAQEAFNQHEPGVATFMAIRAGTLFGIRNDSGNKQAMETKNEVIQVFHKIFETEGSDFGFVAARYLNILDPHPQGRTPESDRRITGEKGVRDHFSNNHK